MEQRQACWCSLRLLRNDLGGEEDLVVGRWGPLVSKTVSNEQDLPIRVALLIGPGPPEQTLVPLIKSQLHLCGLFLVFS